MGKPGTEKTEEGNLNINPYCLGEEIKHEKKILVLRNSNRININPAANKRRLR